MDSLNVRRNKHTNRNSIQSNTVRLEADSQAPIILMAVWFDGKDNHKDEALFSKTLWTDRLKSIPSSSTLKTTIFAWWFLWQKCRKIPFNSTYFYFDPHARTLAWPSYDRSADSFSSILFLIHRSRVILAWWYCDTSADSFNSILFLIHRSRAILARWYIYILWTNAENFKSIPLNSTLTHDLRVTIGWQECY